LTSVLQAVATVYFELVTRSYLTGDVLGGVVRGALREGRGSRGFRAVRKPSGAGAWLTYHLSRGRERRLALAL
jgi:hypothetical protein